MSEHIKKAHPDNIHLTGMDVRYFGNLLVLVKAAARTNVVPLNPMELLWVIRMEKLANRTEFIDIENEPQLPRIEPEPEVLPAIDVVQHEEGVCHEGNCAKGDPDNCPWNMPLGVFEDDGGYTGPAHD